MSGRISVFNDTIACQSMIARIMRGVWTLAAAGSLLAMMASAVSVGIRSDPIKVPDVVSGVTMTNPRFTGRDDRRGSYVLSAESAVVRVGSVIDLSLPVLEDGEGRSVTADTGVYHRGLQILMLQGTVSYTPAGQDDPLLTCSSVRMDLRKLQMAGKDIIVSAPGAKVTADSFYSEGEYSSVRLFGKVTTSIAEPLPLLNGQRN